MNSTTINKEQTLTQIISDSIKQEGDLLTFLETLTVDSAIKHLKQFTISSWFLLKVISAVFFLLAVQVYKLGQQIRVHFQPTLTSVTTKVYNYCKPLDNPIAQFITGLLTPQTTPLTDSNGNPLTIRIQTDSVFTNKTPKSMDSQKQPSTHTNN